MGGHHLRCDATPLEYQVKTGEAHASTDESAGHNWMKARRSGLPEAAKRAKVGVSPSGSMAW